METKPRSDAFREKISPAQKAQLIRWLAAHSYQEVQEFVAAEPPDGFGLTVSTSTLSRFYKEHFVEIDRLRRDELINHTLEQNRQEMFEAGMRDMLDDGITLLLQERVYEILRQPVDSADQLKKIADICRLMKGLDVEPCPQRRFIRRENERQKTGLLYKIQQESLLPQQPNDVAPDEPASPPGTAPALEATT